MRLSIAAVAIAGSMAALAAAVEEIKDGFEVFGSSGDAR